MADQKKVNPAKVKVATAIGLLVMGVGLIAYQVFGQYHVPSAGDFQVFCTTDDGKTYFPDAEIKLPPFDHGGQQAVRAHVFNSKNGPFVGYLERYNPEAMRIITVVNNAAKTAKPGDAPPPELSKIADAQRNGRQVKRPGNSQWVPINSGAAQNVMHVNAPGSSERASEIGPQ